MRLDIRTRSATHRRQRSTELTVPELQPEPGASLQRRHGLMFRLPIKSGSLFRESQRAITLAIGTTYTAAGQKRVVYKILASIASRSASEGVSFITSIKPLNERAVGPVVPWKSQE